MANKQSEYRANADSGLMVSLFIPSLLYIASVRRQAVGSCLDVVNGLLPGQVM